MTVERWRQIEHLYHEAREHGTLVLADADPELRRQVEEMLAQDSAGKILDGPAAGLLEESSLTQLDLAGRTIAHYRIVEQLGQGGMGVIWKARDTNLDRFVAFKVLHASKMADPERKRRFIQEAKAASALNHPNIVTIYDIGQAGGIDFIAMELVSGKALSQLIPRKGLRLGEALAYAVQIADALESAHAMGIVHRDLKPANVVVNASGTAKVLDFGLAKLTEQFGGSEAALTGTQAEAFQTDEGMIVGTVAYMSPEQAQGKKVDARSDIFSFGGMFYEMIAGRRPFEGDSPLSTLSAIIRDDPKPLTQIFPNLPQELDKIITRCLRKDPARRFQTMADLKVVLQDLKEEVDAGNPLPVAASRPRDYRVLAAVSVVLLAVAMAGAWWWKARSGDGPKELAVRPVTADSGLTTDPVLSRDGKLLAYASDRATHNNLDIWIHPLTQGAQPLRLTSNDADDDTPDFSPDGGLIVFHSNRDGGGIYLVPAYGGEERLLVHGGRFPRFSPDGKRIAYSMQHGGTAFLEQSSIYTVPVTGGEAKLLITDVPWAARPVFSGDGRQILFEGATSINDLSSHDWFVAPLAGGRSVKTGAFAVLTIQTIGLIKAYVSDWVGDQVLFTWQGQVWSVRLSEPGWRPTGPARPLTSGNNTVTGARIGKTSFFAFSNAVLSIHMWRLRLDSRTGQALGEIEPLQHSGGSQRYPSASADGHLLAYSQAEPGGRFVRLRDLRTGKENTLLTSDGRPKVSPDGSQVAYSVFPDSVYVMPAGGGESALLVSPQGKSSTQIYAWTPDGKKIVYWWGNPIRFSLLDPRTAQSTELVAHPKYNVHGVELSPDQRWVAFNTPVNGRQQPLWIAAYRDGKVTDEGAWVRVSMDGDERPWWSSDGNLLYFVSRRDGNQCIWAQRLDSITKRPVGAALAVYHLHGTRKMPTGGLAAFGPAVVPDGIIFSLEEEAGNVWIAERKE